MYLMWCDPYGVYPIRFWIIVSEEAAFVRLKSVHAIRLCSSKYARYVHAFKYVLL